MKLVLPFVALLILSACDSTKTQEASSASDSPNSKFLTAMRPVVDSLANASSTEQSIVLPMPETQPSGGDRGSGSVEYYNRSTGTTANYDLDVEYDGNGDVEQINFPSGGYISSYHITDQTHNGDGTITVTTDKGQEFTVDEEEESDTESSEDE
jgi:hypothetical protein